MTVKGTFNDFYPSRWLKADDIPNGEDLVLTIKDVNHEPVGEDQEMKLILSFEEHDKELCLNKTNAGTLEKLFGKDPNSAIGNRVGLYTTEATFKRKTSLAVRIRPTVPKATIPLRSNRTPDPPPPPDPPFPPEPDFDNFPF